MKKLKIEIRELGPIKNVTIDLAPVMIFTGASSLGKSYTNFLVYYVFNLFSGSRLRNFIISKIGDESSINWNNFTFSFTEKELVEWMEGDVKSFFIYLLNYPDIPCNVNFCFEHGADRFTVKVKKSKVDINLADITPLSISINDKSITVLSRTDNILVSIARPIAKMIGKIIMDIDIKHSFLLPPGRASLLNESYTNQKNSSKTGMYDIFLSDFDFINFLYMQKSSMTHVVKEKGVDLSNAVEKIIDGTLVSDKDGLKLKIDEDVFVPLSATASSIKELSPLILWAQTGIMNGSSMCIEEPEAHAHPDMQYDIADLLAGCIMNGAFMQMTTHSDYLLARLNWLMKMHDMKNNEPEHFTQACVRCGANKELTLDKKLVKAYYFYKDLKTQCVCVEEQNVENGIPFTTFSKAVDKQLCWNEVFEDDKYEDL